MTATLTGDKFAEAAEILSLSDDYKVLRKFVPRDRYADHRWDLGEPIPLHRAIYVDVETTGLDRDGDEIIDLGLLPFTFDREGNVYDVGPAVSMLEEPKRGIPKEIQELTHITPDMVKGQRIDDRIVAETIAGADVIIAHNAEFDRQMLERRLPVFVEQRWACSMVEVNWDLYGVHGRGLVNILISATNTFPVNVHRALDDCRMGVHVLAAAAIAERPAMAELLDSMRNPSLRVRALGSPIEAKTLLQARRYRACYAGGRFQYWYKDVKPDDVEAELAWAEEEAYSSPDVVKISARDRYSVRAA